MSRHRIHLAGVLALLGAAVYLAVEINQAGKREVIGQFNTIQSLLARQAVHESVAALQESSRDLQALASLASVQSLDRAQMSNDFRAYYESSGHLQPFAISVVDARGTFVYSTNADVALIDYSGSDLFEWAQHWENQGRFFLSASALMPKEQALLLPRSSFLLATPLFRSNSVASARPRAPTWSGVLVATVDLETVLTNHLAILHPQASSHRVWIMDQAGTILMQSEHPPMIRENINRTKPRCAECHVSFEYARNMLGAKEGVTEYQLRGRPVKLAAFTPLKFLNANWVVVINAPYTEVTAFERREFAKMILLLGLMIAVLSLAFAAVSRSNVSRARAEEEARQAQEKLQLTVELQHRHQELETALANLKTLSGLLPICAGCKKVRDDRGYWQQVETYIERRSEAKFSHGLCPDCCRKLYPDIFPDDKVS